MKAAMLFITVALAATLLGSAAGSRYHAAKCLEEARKCSAETAEKSGNACKASLRAREQSNKCRRLACQWCELKGKREIYPCKKPILRSICFGETRMRKSPNPQPNDEQQPRPARSPRPPYNPSPRPARSPRPPAANRAKCVWTSSSRVVIDLGTIPTVARGWTRTSRGGYSGLIYEKSKNRGIDSAGKKGVMCFNIRVDSPGNYFFAALSYAPHHTEHNDMWVNSPSQGFELWQANKKWRDASTTQWLKAYQNNGPKGLSVSLKTKDHDGHRFIVPDVPKDRVFRMCISGRSYKYEVYRLYLVKCSGVFCTGRPMTNLQSLPVSKCV